MPHSSSCIQVYCGQTCLCFSQTFLWIGCVGFFCPLHGFSKWKVSCFWLSLRRMGLCHYSVSVFGAWFYSYLVTGVTRILRILQGDNLYCCGQSCSENKVLHHHQCTELQCNVVLYAVHPMHFDLSQCQTWVFALLKWTFTLHHRLLKDLQHFAEKLTFFVKKV